MRTSPRPCPAPRASPSTSPAAPRSSRARPAASDAPSRCGSPPPGPGSEPWTGPPRAWRPWRRARALPGGLEPRLLDLTDLDAAEAAAAGTDILVNNAGIQLVRPIEEFPPDVFHTVLTVMLEAPFRLIRGALPHMYGQGWGRIVNLSSVHGLRASAFKSAYVAAKHGLEGLSKTAALEGAPHGVTSNCVNPGYVRTALVERQIADQAAAHGIPPERVLAEVLLKDSALKRLIEPEEVAEAVLYLCTPRPPSSPAPPSPSTAAGPPTEPVPRTVRPQGWCDHTYGRYPCVHVP
ncbi:SDR family oxidoreductase [Streptomyces diastatochromogenes]|nr:SDR family oxidoreductase [Streptomyces diastatochromogenes]